LRPQRYGFDTQRLKIFERRSYVDEEGVCFHSFGADVNRIFVCPGWLSVRTRKETSRARKSSGSCTGSRTSSRTGTSAWSTRSTSSARTCTSSASASGKVITVRQILQDKTTEHFTLMPGCFFCGPPSPFRKSFQSFFSGVFCVTPW